MKKKLFCFSLVLIFFSFIAFIAITALEIFKPMTSINREKCHLFPNIPQNFEGPEDMVKYGDFIIISATNHLKLYEISSYGPSKISGNLWLIHPNDTMSHLPLEDYPDKQIKSFRPFSLNIFGTLLYVLNENYEEENDQIDVFELIKTVEGGLRLKFLYSLTFSENFLGRFNNFFLLDKDEFLITTWQPWPDPPYGRSDIRNLWQNVKKFAFLFFGIKETHVHYCITVEKQKVSCIKLKNTEAIMNNGIAYDKPNSLVYVAKTMEKKVTVFHFQPNKQPEDFLVKLKEIDLPCLPDNLNFDHEKQRILFGCLGRGIDYLRLIRAGNSNADAKIDSHLELWFGLGSIEKDKAKLLIMDDKLYRGMAGGIRRGNSVYVGSFVENRLLVCKI